MLFWQRAIKAGGDSRFDKVKKDPTKFTVFWLLQGIYYFYSIIKPYIIFDQATWITAVGLPVYFCNALPRQAHPPLGGRDYLALGLYATSFLFEVIADRQKSTWRKAKENKEHDEQFISTGLWSVSRHPKYVIFKYLLISLTHNYSFTYLAMLEKLEFGPEFGPSLALLFKVRFVLEGRSHLLQSAPSSLGSCFVMFVIVNFWMIGISDICLKVSGVPPLERAGDKKFGTNPKWQQYKKLVPIYSHDYMELTCCFSSVPIFWPWTKWPSLRSTACSRIAMFTTQIAIVTYTVPYLKSSWPLLPAKII